MTKFNMAYEMGYYKNLPWTVMCDALSKADMVRYYNEFLESKNK